MRTVQTKQPRQRSAPDPFTFRFAGLGCENGLGALPGCSRLAPRAPPSPRPFTPSAFSGEGDSWCTTVIGGTSELLLRKEKLLAHLPVARYWTPAEFEAMGAVARNLGFAEVRSGPLVRSS